MKVLLIIIVLIVAFLAWLGVIPVRLWITRRLTKYYGKKTRLKIRLIKIFEPILKRLEE